MTLEFPLLGRTMAVVQNFCRPKSSAKKTETIGARSAKRPPGNLSRSVGTGRDPLLGLAAEGGESPRQAAAALHKMAKLEHAQKRYAEAGSLYRRALALRQQVLGPSHPKVASTLYNLARLYSDQARWEEAEPLFRESLAIAQQVFGQEHPKVIKRLSSLARFYEEQGRCLEAANVRAQMPGDSDVSLKTEMVGDEI